MNENICKYQSRCWKQFESIAFCDFFVIYNFVCLFVTLISTSWTFPLVHGFYALLAKLGVFRFTCSAKKRRKRGNGGVTICEIISQKIFYFSNDDFPKKQTSVAFLNLIIQPIMENQENGEMTVNERFSSETKNIVKKISISSKTKNYCILFS